MKANKGGIIDERYAVLIMREVLVALSFLHRSNVIHRDLKGVHDLET
jgi:serine/threonine protein kinase